MSKLDEALVDLRQHVDDGRKQAAFYDLFLNSTFFVPVLRPAEAAEEATGAEGTQEILPLITEAEGKEYLMLFSSLERLRDWLPPDEEVPYVEVAGHLLALTTTPPLHWALNVGTEYTKVFHPQEIAWLKDAVESCHAEAAQESGGCCG